MDAMKDNRTAGVILHPTSLPSRFGIGDLGPTAAAYVEWLAGAGASWWQVLPLHPPGPGDSPYSAISTFAGNELLISPDLLAEDGVLSDAEVGEVPDLPGEWVEFDEVKPFKIGLLRRAYIRFRDTQPIKLVGSSPRSESNTVTGCRTTPSFVQSETAITARRGTSGRARWRCVSRRR
jgi:4-alpha-glucanotransferase